VAHSVVIAVGLLIITLLQDLLPSRGREIILTGGSDS